MTDIFEEVEEEVRKDRIGELWRRYGIIVWIVGFAIVAGVAFSEWRGSQQERLQAERMATFEAAIEALAQGQYDVAETSLATIAGSDAAIAPLAAQYLAQVRLEGGGDQAGAIAALDGSAGDVASPFQQLALLKSVYLRSETLTLAEMETELAPLVGRETPMAALAEELIAAQAFAEGQTERARREFNRLRFAAYAPPGLVQRATIALDTIPRSAAAPADAPETPTAGDATEPNENNP